MTCLENYEHNRIYIIAVSLVDELSSEIKAGKMGIISDIDGLAKNLREKC